MTDISLNETQKIWPWTRFFARYVDLSLFISITFTPINCIINRIDIRNYALFNIDFTQKHLITKLNIHSSSFWKMEICSLLLYIICLIMYIFWDAFICKKFGRNLGHKIFGLTIINDKGRELHYRDYLLRSSLVSLYWFLSVNFLILIFPIIIIYRNYKKNKSTYWDRYSNMPVISSSASTMRTSLFFSLLLNFLFILCISTFIVGIVIGLITAIHEKQAHTSRLSTEQKAFIVRSNKSLPARINNLVSLNNVTIENGNVVFHYLIAKQNNSTLTEDDNILLNRTKSSIKNSIVSGICTPKGKYMFKYGKDVIVSYTFQNKTTPQFRLTPSMCPK